ncbi:MAG TPA: hypothetical protein VLZ83_16780 [Edaphocola sp.]|nr:hypothetical protein [Edaphocola sp.]
MTEKEIITNLLIDFKTINPDIDKFKGNALAALGEKLIKFINIMTPYSYLFNDDFKIAVKEYILTYEAARKGEKKGENILKLIPPTNDLIATTLDKKFKALEQ